MPESASRMEKTVMAEIFSLKNIPIMTATITGRAAEYDKPHGVYLLLLFHIPIVHQVDAKLRPGSMGRQLISYISFSTT